MTATCPSATASAPQPVPDAPAMQCDYCGSALTALANQRGVFWVHTHSSAVACSYRLFGGTPQVATPVPAGTYHRAQYAKAGV
jgi:hypothetical protein